MLQAAGRGHHFTLRQALLEALLRWLYVGDWPARLWQASPASARVQLVEHHLALPAHQAPRAPLRVGFASDLHLGPTTAMRTLERAFALLADASLDVLALGGDYVFLEATEARAEALAALVRQVPARTKVAVLGNHDLWTHHARLERALERAGVRVLVNEAERLEGLHDDVALVGLDDPWTGDPDGERAFAGAAGARLVIALSHSPEGLAHCRDRAALVLAGHTHGGQIALPGGRPLHLPPGPFSRRYPHGLHEHEGTRLFVSRGVGGVGLPVRAHAPADVALLVLS